MRQAHARKITNAYLEAPKRSERHLRVVDDADSRRWDEGDEAPRVVEDLRVEAPRVAIPEPDPIWDTAFSDAPVATVTADPAIADPEWAKPFADPRWDDRIGEPAYEERDGRKTVLVTGRPAGSSIPRRDSTPGTTARMRRQTPTRARLAGRPDRVALWAVGLALLMAAIAGVSGNGTESSSQLPVEPTSAPLLQR